MRIIKSEKITEAVSRMCAEANIFIGAQLKRSLFCSAASETSETGRLILGQLVKNAELAAELGIPICQDTGMAVFFITAGKEVYIDGTGVAEAVNEGVRTGYREGLLRNSVVADPVLRGNTGDNTPAVIHYELTEGDGFKIDFMPKGFGSENMSALKMLSPSDGIEGIKDFVIETVRKAGANPCPPLVIGIGLGGTMEKAALLSKQALLREPGSKSGLQHILELEETLLDEINRLGIGPAGLGGSTTALQVSILTYPTHIAGLPVAVNICCHAHRHATAEL